MGKNLTYDPNIHGVVINQNPYSNVKGINVSDDSDYDNGFVLPTQGADPYEALYEHRAQNQPWQDQIANGVAKGTVLAGTTFADTFGGTMVGLINAGVAAANGENALNAFIDNPFSNTMQEINDSMENSFANYRTRQEQNMGLLEKMTTANFWGDTFIKNMGFAAGAMLAGNATAGIFNSLGKTAAISKNSQIMNDIAKSIVAESKGAKTIEEAMQMLNDPEMLRAAAGDLTGELSKSVKQINRWTRGQQITSSAMSSVGEARLEALGNANQYEQKRLGELRQQYGENIPELELAKLQQEKASYQNAEFLTNTLLLSISNYAGYKDIWAKNWDLNSRNIVDKIKVLATGYTETAPQKWYQTLGKAALQGAREGGEELGQTALQYGTENWIRAGHQNKGQFADFISDMSNGVGQALGEEGLESFVVGALTGMLGVPGYKASSKLKIGLNGGIYDSFKQANIENKQAAEASSLINSNLEEALKDHADDPKQLSTILLGMVNRHISFSQAQDEALKSGDRHMYEWLKSEKVFNLINSYIEAGKLESFHQMLDDETKLSADDIRKKYAVKNKEGKGEDYFAGKTDEEVLQFIKDKSVDIKKKTEDLRKIRDDVEVRFGKVAFKAGDKEILAKDLLARHLFLGKELDSRIAKLHSELFTNKDILNKLLLNINDVSLTKDDAENIAILEALKQDPIQLEELVSKDKDLFRKLTKVLSTQFLNKKIDPSLQADIKDYVSLLQDRLAHNKAWMQLTDNDLSNLIANINSAEKKAEKEDAEKLEKELSDEDYIESLSEQARKGGYNEPDAYGTNEAGIFDRNGLFKSLFYFLHNNTLKSLKLVNGKIISYNPITNKQILDSNGVPEEFTKDFVLKNKGKLSIVPWKDAKESIRKYRVTRDNTTKLQALELLFNNLTIKTQEAINRLKDSELLKSKIQDKLDELQAIEAADGIVNRKQFDKRLNNLKQLLDKVNTEIDSINALLNELSQYEEIMNNFKAELTISLNETKTYSINEKLKETDKEYEAEIKSLEKFLEKDFTKDIELAYNELDDYKKDLEDRQKVLEDLISVLEEDLKLADALYQTKIKDLDKVYVVRQGELAFYKKWKGVTNEIKTGGSPFKLTKRIKYAITRYALERGMDRKQAMNEYLEDLKKLDNDINESKNFSRNVNLYKEQLYLSKQELEEINNKLNSIKEAFGENINERKNEYVSLEKKLDKIEIVIKNIRSLQAAIIREEYNRAKSEQSQNNRDVDTSEDINNLTNDYELLSLSTEIFRSTNNVEAYDVQNDKKYVTKYDEAGYPIMNPAESSLRYNNFLQDNFNNLNSDNPSYKIRIFKLNDVNTPKDLNDAALNTIKVNDEKYVPERDYIIVFTDVNGQLIKQDDNYIFTFLPLKDNALRKSADVGKVFKYLKLVGNFKDLDINDVRSYKKNNSKIEINGKFFTYEEVVSLAESFAEKLYDEFLNKIDANLEKGVLLNVRNVSNGHTVKQRVPVSENEKQPYKYQNPIPILVKKVKDLNIADLKIEVANANNRIGERYVTAGHAVITLPTGEIIPIRGRKLNDNEVQTILHLISMSDVETSGGKYGLKNLKIPLPEGKKENNNEYIPVFGYSDQEKNNNVISRLIYWGRNSKSPNEIYIDKGEVIFKVLTIDGEYVYKKLAVSDVLDKSKNAELVAWLSDRHLNINRSLASKSEKLIYFHPVLEKGVVTFKYRNGYSNYLIENDMIESNIVDNKNPNTKNIIFANKYITFAEDSQGIPSIKNLPENNKPSESSPAQAKLQKIENAQQLQSVLGGVPLTSDVQEFDPADEYYNNVDAANEAIAQAYADKEKEAGVDASVTADTEVANSTGIATSELVSPEVANNLVEVEQQVKKCEPGKSATNVKTEEVKVEPTPSNVNPIPPTTIERKTKRSSNNTSSDI